MNRFSVLYLLRGQYQHVGANAYGQAQAILRQLKADKRRMPVGVYDAKTELFEWEPSRQHDYEQATIEEQGKRAEEIITIAQALRQRDASWHPRAGFRRPSLFA
jgi:hypothetical protein